MHFVRGAGKRRVEPGEDVDRGRAGERKEREASHDNACVAQCVYGQNWGVRTNRCALGVSARELLQRRACWLQQAVRVGQLGARALRA